MKNWKKSKRKSRINGIRNFKTNIKKKKNMK